MFLLAALFRWLVIRQLSWQRCKQITRGFGALVFKTSTKLRSQEFVFQRYWFISPWNVLVSFRILITRAVVIYEFSYERAKGEPERINIMMKSKLHRFMLAMELYFYFSKMWNSKNDALLFCKELKDHTVDHKKWIKKNYNSN